MSDGETERPDAAPPVVPAPPGAPLAVLERRVRRWRLTSGVLAIVSLFLGVVVAGQLSSSPAVPAASAPATPGDAAPAVTEPAAPAVPDLSRRIEGDPLAIGAVDAPVVLIEWFDYRCPFCASHSTRTEPALIAEYVDAGLVRIEYHDIVLFGEDSLAAAVAGRAAGNQGKFHEYLAVLFADAPDSGHPDMPREKLIAFAEKAGVADIAQFTADLDDPALIDAVAQSTQQARSLGISSVPFFVVGDAAVAGAQPLEAFQAMIDEQLAAADG